MEAGLVASHFLRGRLQAEAERRGITLRGPVTESIGAVGSRGDWSGTSVYLKVLEEDSDEHLAGALLAAWCRGPVVRVLDSTPTAQVLEWLEPGSPLEARYEALGDEAGLHVLAQSAASLKRLNAPDIGYPSAHERGRSLLARARPVQIDADLWRLASEHYRHLAGSQRDVYVVHGDLHHGNILWTDQRGWVVVDPKGVIAELEFEIACALRNPIAKLNYWAHDATVRRRIGAVAGVLGLDPRRLVGWCFAQCVLAAAWEVEDGLDPAPWIAAAHAYFPLLSSGA